MKHVVILNGPPLSGKDFIADAICAELVAEKHEFKEHLRNLVKLAYQLDDALHDWLYRRDNKERPQACLDGRSIRQAYQHMSENVMKPAFGRDYFGKVSANKLVGPGLFVFSDGGFVEEVQSVAETVDRIDLIHLHAAGTSFSGDTRGYVTLQRPNVFTHRVDNNYTSAPIARIIKDIIQCKSPTTATI